MTTEEIRNQQLSLLDSVRSLYDGFKFDSPNVMSKGMFWTSSTEERRAIYITVRRDDYENSIPEEIAKKYWNKNCKDLWMI